MLIGVRLVGIGTKTQRRWFRVNFRSEFTDRRAKSGDASESADV